MLSWVQSRKQSEEHLKNKSEMLWRNVLVAHMKAAADQHRAKTDAQEVPETL
jgi:hypothetical protein